MLNRRILLTLFVLTAAFAYGAYQIWHGLQDANEAGLSERWPTVDGKILSHSVARQFHRYGADTFEPIVWYAYSVENVPYKDSRIAWHTEMFNTEPGAVEFMDKHYPIGGSVQVHYDPNHPHHACLIPGEVSRARTPVYAALMMIVVLILVGGFRLFRLALAARN